MIHLHARDEAGAPTGDPEAYRALLEPIRRAHPELVLVASTSGRLQPEFHLRSRVLELEGAARPDMASLTLGSLNFSRDASLSPPDTILRLAEAMQRRGIKPELEVFDLGMINMAHRLIQKGLLEPPYFFNLILGNVATAQARLQHLGLMVSELPPQSLWSAGGIGGHQLSMNAVGIVFGDSVRVGLEDNLHMDAEREEPATNPRLVERIAAIASALGRPVADAAEARRLLGLPPPAA